MKSIIKALMLTTLVLVTVACERGLTERERECLELTQDAQHCIRSANRVYAPTNYTPTEHVNYYGHPDYGYWDNGHYRFNDPNSHYASSTNAFLLGAGLGGLASYTLTSKASQSNWKKNNPSGWTEKKSYTDKNGKSISKKEFDRRKQQSIKDKAAHKQKLTNKPVNKTSGTKPVVPKKPLTSDAKKNNMAKKYSKPSSYNKPKKPSYSKPKPSKSKKRY